MRYFLVFGMMYNKIVTAKSEAEVKGTIIKEMTIDEVKEYAAKLDGIPNAD